MDILIKNEYVMLGKNRIIKRMYLLIKNGKIIKIKKKIEEKAEISIDAKSKLITPGLINTHTYIPMSLFRGIVDDLELMEWLKKYIWTRETKLTKKTYTMGLC